MTLAIILIIVALGLIFIFIEIFLIPGTAFVGILGGVLVLAGVILAYLQIDAATGNTILIASFIAFAGMLIFGFRRVANLKWGLNENIEGKVNVLQEGLVNTGDEGITFSDLRPNGKAVINDIRLEVYSMGEFIPKNTEIIVTKVTSSKIFVKPKNT